MEANVNFDFGCFACSYYVKPNKKGYMGFCPIHNKRVKKDHSCEKNPTHKRLHLWLRHRIPVYILHEMSDKEVEEFTVNI